MDTEAAARRRAYKTRWERKKRARERALRGKEVRVVVPKGLERVLRPRIPRGQSLATWIVRQLRAIAGDELAEATAEAVASEASGPRLSGAARNGPCPCGCGRKAKHCAGGLVRL